MITRNSLKTILIKYGYSIAGEVNNVPELLRETRRLFPDLVIIASDIEGGSILEAAGIIEYDQLAAVLILTDDLRSYSTDKLPQIMKPFSPETLLSAVEICLLYHQRFNSMRNELNKMRENLENRKMIEKAKGVLMKQMGISEEEAYSKMRKLSMDKSTSLIKIACAVIETDA